MFFHRYDFNLQRFLPTKGILTMTRRAVLNSCEFYEVLRNNHPVPSLLNPYSKVLLLAMIGGVFYCSG